jgi:hypothetical protein
MLAHSGGDLGCQCFVCDCARHHHPSGQLRQERPGCLTPLLLAASCWQPCLDGFAKFEQFLLVDQPRLFIRAGNFR